MSDLYTQFDSVFFEKTRLSLVTLLYREEQTFNGLKAFLKLSDGALYTHLEKLLTSAYLGKKKVLINDSAHTTYRLTPSGRKAFEDYLRFLENMLKSIKK